MKPLLLLLCLSQNPTLEVAEPAITAVGPAFEVNVLWPFFPGGLVDVKVMFPVLRADRESFRGELLTGVHSDFGWRFISARKETGRVAILAGKLGYRQYFVHGLHLEAAVNFGWRHEEDNPVDGAPIDSFQGRLWTMAGWQYDFTPRVYANARGGLGVHLFRTDRLAHREAKLIPVGDLNIGVRF